jgi:RNA polymerase sigma-70 factor (ECF subfamily)
MAPPIFTDKINTAEEREIKARINQAIDALPPRCKEVFCKSRLEGKKYAEIAADLGIAVKTVEVQMGKALKILREQLADLAMIWVIYLFI